VLSTTPSAFARRWTPSSARRRTRAAHKVEGTNYDLGHGDVVLAAITSCTNTSNPSVMIGAGLLARNAVAKGLTSKPWVKTSLAPGSQVVAEYFEKSGLQTDLDALGFNLVGFGCGSCIGNSGPLIPEVSKAVNDNDLVVCSVLSGNRNFEGRVNPDVRANYLASPPLVVAYALAGSMLIDLAQRPLGTGSDGQPVYLKDIWPSSSEIQDLIDQTVTSELFGSRYADVFTGDERWRGVEVTGGLTFEWDMGSTYVQNPPYFEGMTKEPKPVTTSSTRASSAVRRLDHHRPHLARRQHPARSPAGKVPARRRSRSASSTSTARAAATTRS
jgi:aconitate hydratase